MGNENIVLNHGPGSEQMPSKGLVRLQKQAEIFAMNSKSENTRRAYRQQWDRFQEWCRDHGVTCWAEERPVR